jgi:putative ABC transport system substrate-binding protein
MRHYLPWPVKREAGAKRHARSARGSEPLRYGVAMVSRRAFLYGSIAALARPRTAETQPTGRIYRIGFLRNGPPPETFIDGFRKGLRELGYVEGQNISIEYGLARSADELPSAAARLVSLKVDVLLASGTPPIPAAKSATKTIPIVFVASIDPVATGMVASLARPGGNITGFAGVHSDLMGKRLELLRDAVHRLARVAVLSHATNPGNAEYIRQAELAAQALGVQLQVLAVRDAGDFERVFREARGASAVIQLDDVIFTSYRRQVVELAARHQLATMYGFKEFVHAGGLMAYGPEYPDLYRRAATYVDKILKGTNPADLPIEQPTKFELVINLKTAKALGLAIPPSVLVRADEVIQ